MNTIGCVLDTNLIVTIPTTKHYFDQKVIFDSV